MVVNIFLFDDFDMLEAFVPASLFGKLPKFFYVRYLSKNGGLVSGSQGVKVWTEPLNPVEIEDILLVPGGAGAGRVFYTDENLIPLLKRAVENADYCLSGTEGTLLLIQSGVLYHRTVAAVTKKSNWQRMFVEGAQMVPDVKWISDGKFYTCSETMHYYDMVLNLIADCLDIEQAQQIADDIRLGWSYDEEGIL